MYVIYGIQKISVKRLKQVYGSEMYSTSHIQHQILEFSLKSSAVLQVIWNTLSHHKIIVLKNFPVQIKNINDHKAEEQGL